MMSTHFSLGWVATPSVPFRATEEVTCYYSDFHFSLKKNALQERFKSFSSGG